MGSSRYEPKRERVDPFAKRTEKKSAPKPDPLGESPVEKGAKEGPSAPVLGLQKKRVKLLLDVTTSAGFDGRFALHFETQLRELESILTEAESINDPKEFSAIRKRSIVIIEAIQNSAKKVKDLPISTGLVVTRSLPTRLTVLFLTDLHWKGGSKAHGWANAKNAFFESLAEAKRMSGGSFDLVVFTGDLVFSGQQGEFSDLDKLLEEIFAYLGSLESRPPFFAVPGNHDVTRPSAQDDKDRAQLLATSISRREFSDVFWSQDGDPCRKLVERAFAHYMEWQDRSLAYQVDPEKKVSITRRIAGLLPGDFSYSFEKDGRRIGLVGLNTSFVQLLPGPFAGKIALHEKQFEKCCPEGWLQKHDLNILLTHHPTSWLDQKSIKHYEEFCLPTNFALQLQGHLHEPAYAATATRPNRYYHQLQAPSLFGEPDYLDENERPLRRTHGYCVVQFLLDGGATSFRFWPRVFTPDQKMSAPSGLALDNEGWSQEVVLCGKARV